MAKFREIVDQKGWRVWVESLPPVIQELCTLLPPDRLYRLKTTGLRVTLFSYGENRTVTVEVTGKFNMVMFNRRVFGIRPEDLEECDLPAKDEMLGTILTERQDIDAYIDSFREKE